MVRRTKRFNRLTRPRRRTSRLVWPVLAVLPVLIISIGIAWLQTGKPPLELVTDLAASLPDYATEAGRKLIGGPSQSATVQVWDIIDGDTIKVQHLGRIRLHEIDTPEKGQPYGPVARRALAGKIQSKTVRVDVYDTDRYGRKVAKIWLGERDINREMVREGYAWAYRDYLNDWSLILDERAAQEAGIGLWARDNPIPPWEYRRGRR